MQVGRAVPGGAHASGGWLIVGSLLLAALAVALIGAHGPFGSHPQLAYDQFVADFRAGHVGQITQWSDQLEVTDDGQLRIVMVPPNRDLAVDLAQARQAGGVGIDFRRLPDAWLTVITPLGPALLAVAGFVIWVTAIRGDRRRSSGRPQAIG